jgi:glc operon protein GlcG
MTTSRTRQVLDDAGVDAVVQAAESFALGKGYRVVMTVVDRAGTVLALRRTPQAQAASSQVAVDKARTAAIFVRPSRDIEQQVTAGRLGALALHGAAALTGGIPLRVGDDVVGAIGTSGETPDEDESVSVAGAATTFSTIEVPALTYDVARRVAESAGALAQARGVAPVAAVVDEHGELVYLWRPDAAQVASVGVATDKARTAAIYRRPSKDFELQATNGRPSALHLAGAVPLQGGIPLVLDGYVVGAIGVSGASSADEDQELAVLGAAALDAVGAATHIPRQRVQEQFRTGGLLLETPDYKLDAGRRSAPGDVELHDAETDIMQVVEGRATVVTGEQRHELDEGDVLVIPSGVPHQFVDVTEPFLYFVTKVEA